MYLKRTTINAITDWYQTSCFDQTSSFISLEMKNRFMIINILRRIISIIIITIFTTGLLIQNFK